MLEMVMAAFVLGMVVAAPIGPVSIASGKRAITHGFEPAFFFTLGSLTSDGFYILLVYIGIAPLLTESDILRLLMWSIGGTWLCWLGVEALRTHVNSDDLAGVIAKESRLKSYGAGLIITLTNPLTIVSWIALAGNFFAGWREGWSPREETGWLALIVIISGTATWALGMAWILSSIRHFISPRVLRWISIGAGLILIFFGLSAWFSAIHLVVR